MYYKPVYGINDLRISRKVWFFDRLSPAFVDRQENQRTTSQGSKEQKSMAYRREFLKDFLQERKEAWPKEKDSLNKTRIAYIIILEGARSYGKG